MGMATNIMLENQSKLDAAIEIAIRAKYLKRCEYHPDCIMITDDTDDFTAVYRLGNSLMSKNDPLTSRFNVNRREMTDKIKEAMESSGEYCYSCDHWERE